MLYIPHISPYSQIYLFKSVSHHTNVTHALTPTYTTPTTLLMVFMWVYGGWWWHVVRCCTIVAWVSESTCVYVFMYVLYMIHDWFCVFVEARTLCTGLSILLNLQTSTHSHTFIALREKKV